MRRRDNCAGAVGAQKAMAQDNAAIAAEERNEWRTGINVGDVVVEADDISLTGQRRNAAAPPIEPSPMPRTVSRRVPMRLPRTAEPLIYIPTPPDCGGAWVPEKLAIRPPRAWSPKPQSRVRS
jgi:hypothetical protein